MPSKRRKNKKKRGGGGGATKAPENGTHGPALAASHAPVADEQEHAPRSGNADGGTTTDRNPHKSTEEITPTEPSVSTAESTCVATGGDERARDDAVGGADSKTGGQHEAEGAEAHSPLTKAGDGAGEAAATDHAPNGDRAEPAAAAAPQLPSGAASHGGDGDGDQGQGGDTQPTASGETVSLDAVGPVAAGATAASAEEGDTDATACSASGATDGPVGGVTDDVAGGPKSDVADTATDSAPAAATGGAGVGSTSAAAAVGQADEASGSAAPAAADPSADAKHPPTTPPSVGQSIVATAPNSPMGEIVRHSDGGAGGLAAVSSAEVVADGPGPMPPATAQLDLSAFSYEQRLRAFYEAFNPAKVGDVPRLVKQYAGRERDLFQALGRKYGVTTDQAMRIAEDPVLQKLARAQAEMIGPPVASPSGRAASAKRASIKAPTIKAFGRFMRGAAAKIENKLDQLATPPEGAFRPQPHGSGPPTSASPVKGSASLGQRSAPVSAAPPESPTRPAAGSSPRKGSSLMPGVVEARQSTPFAAAAAPTKVATASEAHEAGERAQSRAPDPARETGAIGKVRSRQGPLPTKTVPSGLVDEERATAAPGDAVSKPHVSVGFDEAAPTASAEGVLPDQDSGGHGSASSPIGSRIGSQGTTAHLVSHQKVETPRAAKSDDDDVSAESDAPTGEAEDVGAALASPRAVAADDDGKGPAAKNPDGGIAVVSFASTPERATSAPAKSGDGQLHLPAAKPHSSEVASASTAPTESSGAGVSGDSVTSLREENAQLSVQLTELQRQADADRVASQAEIQRLQKQLADLTSEHDAHFEQLRKQNAALESAHRESLAELDSSRQNLSGESSAHAQSRARLKTTLETVTSLQAELKSAKKAGQQAAVQARKDTAAAVKAANDAAKSKLQAAQREARAAADTARREASALRKQLVAANKRVAKLEPQLSAAETAKKALTQEWQEMKKEVAELREQSGAAARELSSRRAAAAEHSATTSAMSQEIELLQETREKARAVADTASSQLRRLEEERDAAVARSEQLTREVAALVRARDQLESSLTAQLRKASKSRDAAVAKAKSTKALAAKLTARVRHLQAKLTNARSRLDDVQVERDTLRAQVVFEDRLRGFNENALMAKEDGRARAIEMAELLSLFKIRAETERHIREQQAQDLDDIDEAAEDVVVSEDENPAATGARAAGGAGGGGGGVAGVGDAARIGPATSSGRQSRGSSRESLGDHRGAMPATSDRAREETSSLRRASDGDVTSDGGSDFGIESQRTAGVDPRTAIKLRDKQLRWEASRRLVAGQLDLTRQLVTDDGSFPDWEDDNEVVACRACSEVFSWMRWKHHCRNCGKVFCGDCSNKQSAIPRLGIDQARVCDSCFLVLKKVGGV